MFKKDAAKGLQTW